MTQVNHQLELHSETTKMQQIDLCMNEFSGNIEGMKTQVIVDGVTEQLSDIGVTTGNCYRFPLYEQDQVSKMRLWFNTVGIQGVAFLTKSGAVL